MEAQYLAFDVLRHSQTDVALVAEAGSGKTLAYLVPLLEQLLQLRTAGRNPSRMLYVVVPTHDLASQVLRVARRIVALTPLTIACFDRIILADANPTVFLVGSEIRDLPSRHENTCKLGKTLMM
jgi:superfamily II DNA/RNA helicase